MTPIFFLAAAMLLLKSSGYGYLLRPDYWRLSFRLHVLIPLKQCKHRRQGDRCWSDGCRRPPVKFEPRYGWACTFHWAEFMRECGEVCNGD